MLILLPPSEGKALPRRGAPLDLSTLGFPELHEPRAEILDALLGLCAGRGDDEVDHAVRVLGLSPGQRDLVTRNRDLGSAPTARADRVYSGVLYDALSFTSLSAAAKRRAASRVAIVSSLFGLVRPADRIPAYRLAGDVSLPGLGPVAGVWRAHLGPAVGSGLGRGLLVDLRSTTYAAFWRPPADLAPQVATVRVLQESHGKRSVVSHFNKATKGRLVRDLLEDGRNPRRPAELAGILDDLGWTVEVGDASGKGTRLDVVVGDLSPP